MAVVLQIGAGGVGGVVAHKMAKNREVFSRIVLASRTLDKCKAIADSIRAKGLGEIEIESVDADNVESVVALIEKYRPKLVVNVALPYQDLAIMEACLRTKTHYLDTANYEHPDNAHFEYKEQWAYDTRYKEAGIFALLGSGFDPGVTNVFCSYAQKHYFDEIYSIDILDCNAGDHGYAFATNFNPEINLREVSSKARYWVSGDSNSKSQNADSNAHLLVSQTDLNLNPDLQQDTIYRKFEREEKHFSLESNTQDLKVEGYFGGEWRDIAPLALMKEWDYPEVGVKNSYLLYHEELESLIRNIKGLRKIRFFMTFGESYLTHMKCLENVGLLRVDCVPHKGGSIVPIEVLKTLLPDPASLAPRTKGKTNIGCYMRGVKDGKERIIYIYNVCEHEKCFEEVNAQGVSYTTGVPAMIGAKLICEGKWGVGAQKNVSLMQSSQELEKSSIDRRTALSQSDFSAQPANLKQDTYSLDSNVESFNAERLKLNADMPKGGEYQGIDTGYWIVCCQPEPFKNQCGFDGKNIKESWRWTLTDKEGKVRKNESCFKNMKVGDNILCYVSSDKDSGGTDKIQAFCAVFSICNKDDESIFLKFQCELNIKPQDIPEETINLYRDKHSAFTKSPWGETGNNWFNGTFFKTTREQFEAIVKVDKNVNKHYRATQGAGVWNMEQNDPDPFMEELNKQGLPFVVLEVESNGEVRVREDGRK